MLDNGDVRIFSRNLEDNTSKYPDIVSTFKAHLKPGVRSIVIDSEAVAFDRASQKILPFQVLSTRAKKGVEAKDVKVNVCLYAFDCLYADGRTLLREPLTERRRLLYACLTEKEGELQFAKQHTSRDLEELSTFLDESIAANTEGLIVKTMDATYEPSRRSLNWLKLKKDYLEGCGDSLDLVVIGAWHGRGKRTGVYGAFLLACYDEESESYQTICKVGTGLSEQALADAACVPPSFLPFRGSTDVSLSLQILSQPHHHPRPAGVLLCGRRPQRHAGRVVRPQPGVGDQGGGPVHLARPPGRRGAGGRGEGHRAALPPPAARARRQEAGGGHELGSGAQRALLQSRVADHDKLQVAEFYQNQAINHTHKAAADDDEDN